ncbi:MAG TPA: bacteriohopanetetrol glucosamine biosynthesis glycosyltransferase HpnI [Candidatus Dormibacteraeota bacterium]|nr:bacteriohopanetetrol glucosamine biosynthesis glycosyltransferase HpnI [Candidatus Dormibacteraeota bacterium]
MIHSIVRIFQVVAILGCASSSIYYILCLRAAGVFLRARQTDRGVRPTQALPPVSILKPLKGTDPDIYESFRSHCLQDYPEYEIVFGVSDPADPAIASVEQLQREFPERSIHLVVCPNLLGANVKVSNLEQMVGKCRYQHLIVNDSDIRVEPDYLRRVMAPLMDDRVGMVTCLYRGVAGRTLGSQLEALGISTDFCVGVLVAQYLEGGLRFGLGSTLAFRRPDLEAAGGFHAIVDFLADDYELGRRIAGLGLKVVLSDVVVETHLPSYGLHGFFAHQMRWARGVRDARLGGYIGLASTFGLMWALVNLIAAQAAPWSWAVLGAVALLRVAVALAVGKVVLRDQQMLRQLWLLPVRDLIAVGVWMLSFAGHTVTWRGDRFTLKDGRLTRIAT